MSNQPATPPKIEWISPLPATLAQWGAMGDASFRGLAGETLVVKLSLPTGGWRIEIVNAANGARVALVDGFSKIHSLAGALKRARHEARKILGWRGDMI